MRPALTCKCRIMYLDFWGSTATHQAMRKNMLQVTLNFYALQTIVLYYITFLFSPTLRIITTILFLSILFFTVSQFNKNLSFLEFRENNHLSETIPSAVLHKGTLKVLYLPIAFLTASSFISIPSPGAKGLYTKPFLYSNIDLSTR